MSKKNKKNNVVKNQVDWFIHVCRNGPCECGCGCVETGFVPDMCNAHTHGMENYGHLDFQMVLRYPDDDISTILNGLCFRVQNGEKLHAGQMVKGIFSDCDVRLDKYEETGRTVLRLIIPDGHNRFPEDPECEAPFSQQLIKTDDLCTEERRRAIRSRYATRGEKR